MSARRVARRVCRDVVTGLPRDPPKKPRVSLEAWSNGDPRDAGRARRLLFSYVAASIVVAALLAVSVVFGGQIRKQVFDEPVDIKFVPPAERKEPPPPPPPPPPPLARKAKARSEGPPPPLAARVDATPTELPKAKPPETDPSAAVTSVPFGQGDPNGCVGCTGKPGGGGGFPDASAPRTPSRPYQVAEVTTAPVAISKTMPSYPDEARKQGVDTVVIVKFVVTENGDVEDVTVVRGHPTLDAVVVQAVTTWKFTPGTLDGTRVRVVRLMKFPFHLRTAH